MNAPNDTNELWLKWLFRHLYSPIHCYIQW